jgi:hypothetical protein
MGELGREDSFLISFAKKKTSSRLLQLCRRELPPNP